jgi:catechol 2,3-dioxygenase-like lactoylglutathione lyase family enzyme
MSREVDMPKIKHIAIATEKPEEAARFYEDVFGLQRVGQVESSEVDGVYLSDGEFNMALLRFKAGAIRDEMDRGEAPARGLHHIGFLVEDTDAVREKLRERGATPRNQRPLNANMFFEEKFTAAGDVIVDITEHPWPGVAPLAKS